MCPNSQFYMLYLSTLIPLVLQLIFKCNSLISGNKSNKAKLQRAHEQHISKQNSD